MALSRNRADHNHDHGRSRARVLGRIQSVGRRNEVQSADRHSHDGRIHGGHTRHRTRTRSRTERSRWSRMRPAWNERRAVLLKPEPLRGTSLQP
jgi:hypothetical protein